MAKLTFLLGLCILALSKEEALAFVNVNYFRCDFDGQHMTNGYCGLTKSRHKLTYLNMGFSAVNVDKVSLRIVIFRLVKKKYQVFGPQIKQNLCELGKADTFDYFHRRIFSMVLKRLQSWSCPFTGNFSFNKYAFMLPMPKALMPESDYLMHTVMSRDMRILLVANVSFTVTA